jgi:PEP-CTERM motif
MKSLPKLLATAVFSTAVMAAAAPAYAVTIVPISTGPFSLPGNPSGTIPVTHPPGPLGWTGIVAGTNTYDFTFTTIGGTYGALLQMQLTNLHTGFPTTVTFNLFEGLPGSGTLLAPSAGTPTAATLLAGLKPGAYYMELHTISAPAAFVTGGLTLIPEPASWAILLLGLGGVGAFMRRQRGTA